MNSPQERRHHVGTGEDTHESIWNNHAAPIILGIIVTIFLFFLILLLMGVLPFDTFKGDAKESKKIDAAISLEEEQVMNSPNETGSLASNEPPARPDSMLSKMDAPFQAEEQKEEDQMDG